MDILTQLAGGGFLGTIGGILGSLGTSIVEYKNLKLKLAHELSITKLNGQLELSGRKMDLQGKRIEGEIQTALATEQSLQASFKHDAAIGAWMSAEHASWGQRWLMTSVDSMRKSVRPILTFGTVIYVMFTYGRHWRLILASDGVPLDTILQQAQMIMSAIIAMATMSFSWWFADRQLQKRMTEKLFGGVA